MALQILTSRRHRDGREILVLSENLGVMCSNPIGKFYPSQVLCEK